MVDNMSKRGFDPLTYRFVDEAPLYGEMTDDRDGVYWVRIMWGRLKTLTSGYFETVKVGP